MVYLFIIICVIIAFLIAIMFLILKNTVKKINSQTKTYFVDKLQEYDYLINEKEAKLKEINEQIKNKKFDESTITKDKTGNYEFDSNIIDLFNSTKYQDKAVFELSKKINENFIIDYESLVRDFLEQIKGDNKYDFCLNLRNKFNPRVIYEAKTKTSDELDTYLKSFLTGEEYKIYDIYKIVMNKKSINGFINYLDELIDLNNPNIKIYVSNEKENYDHLSNYIKTIVSNDIYKGIRIVYKNKIYDFSLSERNV